MKKTAKIQRKSPTNIFWTIYSVKSPIKKRHALLENRIFQILFGCFTCLKPENFRLRGKISLSLCHNISIFFRLRRWKSPQDSSPFRGGVFINLKFWLPPALLPIPGRSHLKFENFDSSWTPPHSVLTPTHFGEESPGGVTPPEAFLTTPHTGGIFGDSHP